jgi:hypothetical protein
LHRVAPPRLLRLGQEGREIHVTARAADDGGRVTPRPPSSWREVWNRELHGQNLKRTCAEKSSLM